MWPAPWIVLFTLVRPPPKTPITLLGLFDMLSVPPPVSITAAGTALATINCVAVPVLFIFRWPPLLMVPAPAVPMERETPLLKLKLSSESMVRLAAEPLMSRATGEAAPFPLSIKALLVPEGTPALHLLALLQFPAPPFQMSFCATARIGVRQAASTTVTNTVVFLRNPAGHTSSMH